MCGSKSSAGFFLLLVEVLIAKCSAWPTDAADGLPRDSNASCPSTTTNSTTTQNPSRFFKSYLRSPTDFTTILLVIGGDIVQKALAQLCGSRYGAPIAFSFGWVSYSFSALASIVGDGTLMPEPEFQSLVVNTGSGYARANSSWVLTRLLRDLERRAAKKQGGLSITFLDAVGRAGEPKSDWVWLIGVFVIPFQLAISVVPWVLHGNWAVFLLTLFGNILAFCGSLMPQWAAEKWCCRRRDGCYGLTRGNGHRHVFVIRNKDSQGLNFEDLAAAHVVVSSNAEFLSRIFFATIAVLWVIFLISAGALDTDTWFLLAVGILGMLQNILVAGATRSPAAHGIDLTQRDHIEGSKVMQVLQDAESRYPGVGLSLLKIFFTGNLWPEEERFWAEKREELRAREQPMVTKGDATLTTGGSGIPKTRSG